MFFDRCRLLLKRIYNAIIMFNREDIAAAQIAQIFGSELLKVQNSARTDGGQTPDIVKINPKQFLVGEHSKIQSKTFEDQRMMEQLQREAEAAYPTNDQMFRQQESAAIPPQISVPQHVPPAAAQPVNINQPPAFTGSLTYSVQTDRLLERIATSLELSLIHI